MTDICKHTEGPWLAAAAPSSVVGWPVVGPQGRLICRLAWMPKAPDVSKEDWLAYMEECHGNANLIGAAVDIKDGCNALLGLVQLLLAREDLPSPIRAVLESNHRINEARAAIAKAEGR